jgi:hypothetical protein
MGPPSSPSCVDWPGSDLGPNLALVADPSPSPASDKAWGHKADSDILQGLHRMASNKSLRKDKEEEAVEVEVSKTRIVPRLY